MIETQKSPLYPAAVLSLLNMSDQSHPASIAQKALLLWNASFADGAQAEQDAFLTQANRLVALQWHHPDGIGGWPILRPEPGYYAAGPFLSASAQGLALSVLTRAYQLTSDKAFSSAATDTLLAFNLDILDGGVQTPLGAHGIFFETVSVYPAAHILHGHILGMLGLYDYAQFIDHHDAEILLQASFSALNTLIDAFDTGYWTYYDFSHRRLATTVQHALHVQLVAALAQRSESVRMKELAVRWNRYQRHPANRLRHHLVTRATSYCEHTIKRLWRGSTIPTPDAVQRLRVCIPVTAFPVPGGIRGVLAGMARAMGERWQTTYVTQTKGPDTTGLDIRTFGITGAHPWHFPGIWLYFTTGLLRLFVLLWRRPGYHLILPQDGISTGAFASLIGKLTGARVVCMDHGSITLLYNPSFREEHASAVRTYLWHQRVRSVLHWPSIRFFARIATRCSDLFLIAGDEVEYAYHQHFGVHPGRIMRYAYMVDAERFTPPESSLRATMREAQDIPTDAIVITLINRLAPEKGLNEATEGLAAALTSLEPEKRAKVRIIIAGDGPLRSQIEADMQRYSLPCILWGVAKPLDVVFLLGLTDIFLYAGTRGTNYSLAVLEAMVAGCAVIATTAPQSNAHLLADGRGIALPVHNTSALRDALVHLCNDATLCRDMGRRSREYIATHHNARMMERTLLRASFFAPPLPGVQAATD